MTEGKRPRSFVRIPRRPRTSREAPSPPHEDRKSAPPVDASSHLDEGHHSERIVIPRHERAGPTKSPLGVELREVRYGSTARTPYLRVVPRQLSFKSVAPGYISATEIGSRPRGRLERLVQAIKGVVLGSPFATARIAEERLTKLKALAIFSSDALSSSAYATEEILLILLLAGSNTLHYALPIAGVIALLIVIVTASYRQTIRAYPSGGGAYIVALENLGRGAGLTAGAALLVDYVLTVSVSVAAGIAAVTSAIPGLHDFRVPLGVSAIALITLGNLRGIREAGTLFALPTYFFILSMSTVIVVGIVRVAIGDAPGSLLHEAPPERQMLATQGLTLFLLMRAFSSGSAALTGIEAISNGVPAFKSPEVPNASTTMTAVAGILMFLFHAFGVFVSFTLSPSGMGRHWLRVKGRGWKTGLMISALGAAATAVVAVIILGTKFTHGAWLSVLMMLLLMGMFALIRRHYDWFQAKIAVDPTSLPAGVPPAASVEHGAPRDHVIVPVDGINKISCGAIAMAREISSMVSAVHVAENREEAERFAKEWERTVPDVPLLVIESPYRAFVAPMLAYLERLDEQEDQRITVILPTFVPRHWWERILHNRDVLRF